MELVHQHEPGPEQTEVRSDHQHENEPVDPAQVNCNAASEPAQEQQSDRDDVTEQEHPGQEETAESEREESASSVVDASETVGRASTLRQSLGRLLRSGDMGHS